MEQDRDKHNQLQVEYFNRLTDAFQQTIPADVELRTAEIVARAALSGGSVILDVGTGTGVLIGHFLAAGARQSNIVGCDLTERMLAVARRHFQEVFFWHGDVLEFSFVNLPADFPDHIRAFDRVFFNACFANLHDPVAVLKHAKTLLKRNGQVIISHPAAQFVPKLHASNPDIVPRLLPSEHEIDIWSGELGLSVKHFCSDKDLYIAVLGCCE